MNSSPTNSKLNNSRSSNTETLDSVPNDASNDEIQYSLVDQFAKKSSNDIENEAPNLHEIVESKKHVKRIFVQNPIYPNVPSLLRHYEHRANYYKQKYGFPFYLVTGAFSLASLYLPYKGFKRTGRLIWLNAFVFGIFWNWVCFSRDFFGNTKGIRKWYLPDDFYVLVPKDEVEEWKIQTLKSWKEKNSQV